MSKIGLKSSFKDDLKTASTLNITKNIRRDLLTFSITVAFTVASRKPVSTVRGAGTKFFAVIPADYTSTLGPARLTRMITWFIIMNIMRRSIFTVNWIL